MPRFQAEVKEPQLLKESVTHELWAFRGDTPPHALQGDWHVLYCFSKDPPPPETINNLFRNKYIQHNYGDGNNWVTNKAYAPPRDGWYIQCFPKTIDLPWRVKSNEYGELMP